MENGLLTHEVSDLCLGKPPISFLPITATVADAVQALKLSSENFISVWSCNHHHQQHHQHHHHQKSDVTAVTEKGYVAAEEEKCECVGKVCMVDVIVYLCKEENVLSPCTAFESPVSVLMMINFSCSASNVVVNTDPNSSLLDAIDLIVQGAQNLIVPIRTSNSTFSRRKHNQNFSRTGLTMHNGREFCWITQEDVVRYFLSSIGLFSTIATVSIATLGLITTDVLSVNYHSPAVSAIREISQSLRDQTSVAVVDNDGYLIGEISPFTLSCCDESVAAAISTLCIGELMSYIDCGGPPDDLTLLVISRLKEKHLDKMCEEFLTCDLSNSLSLSSSSSSSSSSDDESSSPASPTTTLAKSRSRKNSRSMSYSARMVRRAEAIVCYQGSSLVAVMIQAIAHRVNYVWVIEDDCRLVGIVTFANIVRVLREHLHSSTD